jgi:hypothetical protein
MKSFFSLIMEIAVVAGICWYFLPAVNPPKPLTVIKPMKDDFIQWTFCNDSNPAITQSLTVYGDGRSSIVITRPMLDPDLPEGGGWNPKRDPENNCIVFSKSDLVSEETAKRLFADAIESGVLDLIGAPFPKNDHIEIRTSIRGTQQVTKAPTNFAMTFTWNRTEWINRQRWVKVITSIKSETRIYDFLKRKDIVLVDDTPGEGVKESRGTTSSTGTQPGVPPPPPGSASPAVPSGAPDLPPGPERDKVIAMVAKQWVERDPANAGRWCVRVMNEKGATNAVYAVASEWGRKDPEGASRWVTELPFGEIQNTAIRNVASAWAEKNPTAATQWISQLSLTGDLRNQILTEILKKSSSSQ